MEHLILDRSMLTKNLGSRYAKIVQQLPKQHSYDAKRKSKWCSPKKFGPSLYYLHQWHIKELKKN